MQCRLFFPTCHHKSKRRPCSEAQSALATHRDIICELLSADIRDQHYEPEPEVS